VRFGAGVAAGAIVAAAGVAVPVVAAPALATGHRSASSCSVNPAAAAVGATYVVSATGLPTGSAINIWVTAPDGSTTGEPLGSTPDGTFNLNETSPSAGTWTYQFTGPTKHNTTVYGSCSVSVS
jgi:hypothetical protein